MRDPLVHDSLLTPCLWLDAAGRILAVNPAAASWLGGTPRRLQGQDLSVFLPQAAALLAQLGREERLLRARHLGFAALNGEARFGDLWLSPPDAEGQILAEIHPGEEFHGIDPVTALPAALHAALKGLAHEVKNPLAGLKGAAQLLSRRNADPDAQRFITVILDECQRLENLLDRLLDPAAPRTHQAINVHEALERVRTLAEAEAGWSTRIERDYDPSLPLIQGDLDRLAQALLNLVRNALQAGATEVHLRTRAERNVLIAETPHRIAIRIDIADNGRGVPEDLTERIFLPLVSGRAEGSGLGLSLAQQITREHRGSLAYRSRPGHTVFTLLLPVEDAHA
jgi:two-component system, NtrC family, nitrogen regulation sensor histidine kinase GlnL